MYNSNALNITMIANFDRNNIDIKNDYSDSNNNNNNNNNFNNNNNKSSNRQYIVVTYWVFYPK